MWGGVTTLGVGVTGVGSHSGCGVRQGLSHPGVGVVAGSTLGMWVAAGVRLPLRGWGVAEMVHLSWGSGVAGVGSPLRVWVGEGSPPCLHIAPLFNTFLKL